MNFSTKIDQENSIFYRAACLGACVLACGGELFCAAPDVYLQTLISVYNAFFAKENRYLLEAEAAAWRDWWGIYKCHMAELAGPIYTPDLSLELAWRVGGKGAEKMGFPTVTLENDDFQGTSVLEKIDK